MFALREKEISYNEHLQKSLRGKGRPADAVRPQSLHEGASGPEKTQTGEGCPGIWHYEALSVMRCNFTMSFPPFAFRGQWKTPGKS